MPFKTRAGIGAAFAAAFLWGGAAYATDMATGEEMTAAMAGKTFQGSMISDRFAEYYAPDGTIRGEGYDGSWRIDDDRMCFAYGGGEEACWHLHINGPAVTLYKDGEVDGAGMLVEGNPYGF